MLGTLAPSQFVFHKGQSGRGPSPRLWSRALHDAMSPDGNSFGFSISDDFGSFGLSTAVTSNVGRYASAAGVYKSYEDDGAAISQVATEVGGVITLSVDADDNQEAWLQSGGGTGVLGKISDTAGEKKLLIFEARFKTSAVVGNKFIGLSEEGLAAADTIADDGTLASKDFIGFVALEDAPTALKFVYQKAGQSMQTVGTVQTLAVNTWYKVGFIYDPRAVPSKQITAYVDNEEFTTKYITATDIAAATFPDGEELAFLAGLKNVTDIDTLSLDWWAFYQSQ